MLLFFFWDVEPENSEFVNSKQTYIFKVGSIVKEGVCIVMSMSGHWRCSILQ